MAEDERTVLDALGDKGVAALLGFVLMTHEDHEVRVPAEVLLEGLPEDSGVQVFQDPDTDDMVVRISPSKEVDASE